MSHVELVRWPSEAERRSDLARRGVPRLFLVSDGDVPPDVADPLEDWVRVPADEHDLLLRIQRLANGAEPLDEQPALDEHGVLRFRSRWVALSPIEAMIAEPLVAARGGVVNRRTLASAIWPDGTRRARALDPHVHRLRGRLRPLGLDVHTIRGRGFVLTPQPE